MKEGKGTYYFDKENNFSGHWKNNIPHGEGVLIQKGEKKMEGLFRYGKFIKEEKLDEKSKKKKEEKHKHRKHSHSHESKGHKSKNKIKHSESNENNESEKNKDTQVKEKKLADIDGIPGVCTKKKI